MKKLESTWGEIIEAMLMGILMGFGVWFLLIHGYFKGVSVIIGILWFGVYLLVIRINKHE